MLAAFNVNYISIFHQDVVTEVKDIVDLVVRVNFKRLMTIFNVILVCNAAVSHLVEEAVSSNGAAKTQRGFIVNKNVGTRTKGK